MNPNARIESIKAFTPPRPGDSYVHPQFGVVRIIRPAGGDSWWCICPRNPSNRITVRLSKMQRHHEEPAGL